MGCMYFSRKDGTGPWQAGARMENPGSGCIPQPHWPGYIPWDFDPDRPLKVVLLGIGYGIKWGIWELSAVLSGYLSGFLLVFHAEPTDDAPGQWCLDYSFQEFARKASKSGLTIEPIRLDEPLSPELEDLLAGPMPSVEYELPDWLNKLLGGVGNECGCPPPPPPPGPAGPISRRDPLIVDLDGDGVETTNVNTDGAYFDQDSDGFAEWTAWADSDDGLLAMDRDGNGRINNGSELFGNGTLLENGKKAANGFEALAELDSNNDGKFDATDEAYSNLRVWKDLDGDGFSLPDELYSLEDLGIKSINLGSTLDSTVDAQGNTRTRLGTFEWTDGTTGQVAEYNLQQDGMYTLAEEWLDVPEDIAALPDLHGYGKLYDLHQAMVRDSSGELKSLVEQFMGTADPAVRGTLIDQILFKWAGSESVDPTSRGGHIDARKLSVLEEFYGQSFTWLGEANPTNEATISLNETYRQVFEREYAKLMVRTHLKDLYDKITYTWDEEKQQYNTDMSGVIAELQAQLTNNPEQGKQLLSEFARTMRGLGNDRVHCLDCRELFLEMDPSLGWVFDTGGLPVYDQLGQSPDGWSHSHMFGTWGSDAVKGSLTVGDGYINALSGNDVVYGTERNERLYNQDGDALLVGGGGNDIIYAGEGNDILDGGTGNDILYGETGNDTYIFRRDSGQDIIVDADATEDNTDTIFLGSSLTPEEVVLRRVGDNLVLKITGTTDTMTVKDFFRTESTLNRVEQIQRGHGTEWGGRGLREAA